MSINFQLYMATNLSPLQKVGLIILNFSSDYYYELLNSTTDELKTSEVLTVCQQHLLAAFRSPKQQMGERKNTLLPPGFEPQATQFLVKCHTQ